MDMVKAMWSFFDRLEDHVRGYLSHRPITYGFLGGVGVVLFWRGVWHTADWVAGLLMDFRAGNYTIDMSVFPDGPISLLVGSVLLLVTGLFVSSFIGNEVIISGIRGEKRLAEKTEDEIEESESELAKINKELRLISKRLAALERKAEKK